LLACRAPPVQAADEGRRILFTFLGVGMTGSQPNIVPFFWEDPGWVGVVGLLRRCRKALAGLIAVYATSMADQIAASANARDKYVSK
jgi:hypothetical protein